MKRFSSKNNVVYVLDFSGTILKKTTIEGAVKFTGVSKGLIYESILNNTLIYSKYIFSKTPQTVIHTTWVHNPLFNTIPPEIVNEFMIQQRGWEKGINELSSEDKYIEKERLKRWDLILDKTRKNKIKKKIEWDELNQKKEKPIIAKSDTKESNSESHSVSTMLEEMKNDATDNMIESILQDKTTQEIMKVAEPFIISIFKSLLKKFNNDDTRIMSFLDKETGLLCFLDMKTENIKTFEVSGITSENILTIDPKQIRQGDIKHIIGQIIKKYGLFV